MTGSVVFNFFFFDGGKNTRYHLLYGKYIHEYLLVRKLSSNTPNANMADHSVGTRDESNGFEASEALMFCFENASPFWGSIFKTKHQSFVVDKLRFISLCLRVAVFLNATRRD